MLLLLERHVVSTYRTTFRRSQLQPLVEAEHANALEVGGELGLPQAAAIEQQVVKR